MNVKWKIFRALNILLFILPAILYIAVCVAFYTSNSRTVSDWMIFAIVSFCSLIAIANNLLNLYILRNYYPDKELAKPLKIAHNIAGLLYTIYLILLLWQIFIFTNEIDNYREQGAGFIIFFAFLLIFLLLGIILLILQAGLKLAISRSYQQKITETINQIGSKSEK